MTKPPILELLGLTPSDESTDYVRNKGQFHLHRLLTEQRHERTWELGSLVGRDIEAGLRAILAVDDDLERRLQELTEDPGALEQAAVAVADAVRSGRRVYVYGCGATGRLAKQMESSFWRPFWRRVAGSAMAEQVAEQVGAAVADALVGEMTGADRALVSSLEGFEDLPLLGELQLRDHGIGRDDVVICVTEGGETSSVIGTVLAAQAAYDLDQPAEQAAARRRLYFVYNNPDEVLRPFERCRAVLDNPAVTRINLATGPQAIAGSTRMQATTIETFVVGAILEEAIYRLLQPCLTAAELAELGFADWPGIAGRLAGFAGLRAAVARAVPALARWTDSEAATYAAGGHATYYADAAMVTVFTDCTERSPTFRLFPLDAVDVAERRCWVQVWTAGEDAAQAWRHFLGRPFRGLDPACYGPPLAAVGDPYLRRAALASLAQAGDDQEARYDFALSPANLAGRAPAAGDLVVLVGLDDETAAAGGGAGFRAVRELAERSGAQLVTVRVTSADRQPAAAAGDAIEIVLDAGADPLTLRRQVALKILLNAHSTATMARLGRVVGNTMTSVSPSNLKLIGRATFLIQSHVNDALGRGRWLAAGGPSEPIGFAEANAVLFDAIDWVADRAVGQTAEVALSIIRILESRRTGTAVAWRRAAELLAERGLAGYLA